MKKLVSIIIIVFLSLFFTPFINSQYVFAQGTFDCQWRVISGIGACRAVNHECEDGYVPDFEYCGSLTPEGQVVCEAAENQNVACIPISDPYTPPEESQATIYCDSSGEPTTDSSSGELYTAIGCIPISGADDFLADFALPWALGLAGGTAFLLIIYAGFQIITSAGDPKKLQSGKKLLTAAIGGLLLILFSAFILDLIGVDILDLPGFGN